MKHLPSAATPIQQKVYPALTKRSVFSEFESLICSLTQVHTRRLSHGGLIMIERHRLQTNIKPAVLVEARFSFMEWGYG